MNDQKASLKTILNKARTTLATLQHYSLLAFICLVAVLYGFVVWRINSLSHTEPSADAVSSQVKAARITHIDESVVKQLESLQDNSVSVQALFDEARSNPFQ